MKQTAIVLIIFSAAALLLSCAGERGTDGSAEAQAFIDDYTARYLSLSSESSEAEWALNTKIVAGDDSNRLWTERANQAFAGFTGSVEVGKSVMRDGFAWADLVAEADCAEVQSA